MSVLFHFTLILRKLEHSLIIADLLNQNLLGVANGYFPRVLNTIITDKIVMIKTTWPKRPFFTFSFTERQ